MTALSRPRQDEAADPSPDPPNALARDLPAYTDFARSYLRGKGVNDPDQLCTFADDAVQDAWLALRDNPSFDLARPVRPWVKQHIRTAAHNILRQRRLDDGRLREVRTTGLGDDGALSEDDAYALLAGDFGQTIPDDSVIDRARLWAFVEDYTTDDELTLLRLHAQGYSGRWLADRVTLQCEKPIDTGTLNVQLHRLKKRLAKAYADATRSAPLP